jgi:metallo-beta-lactamase family protein
VRDGLRGPVFCTSATLELCRLLLPDSARIQEEDAAYANRKGYSKHHPALPLYTEADAHQALSRLKAVRFGESLRLDTDVTAQFSHAGHILGAASVRVQAGPQSILFSGDLGRYDDLLMQAPANAPAADILVMEGTYGDRLHGPDDPGEALAEIITRTAARGGSVIIPVFAVGRAQLLLHVLARLKAQSLIPKLPIFLNSPMAVDTTALYKRFARGHRLDERELQAMAEVAHMVRSEEESRELNRLTLPRVILSASGMATGGRVLHHLRQLGPDERNTIVLVGYQAPGTRGADLQAGKRSLRMFGQDIPIRAEVASLSGLSAHADAEDLLRWARTLPGTPKRVFVVHAEDSAAQALARRLKAELGWKVDIPALGEHLDF